MLFLLCWSVDCWSGLLVADRVACGDVFAWVLLRVVQQERAAFSACFSADEARGWTPPEEFVSWLRGADLQERYTNWALALFEEVPRFREGGWREELLGSARALSTTKVWGPPPEGVEEVVGEIVAEHPTPKSLFCLRRGALFALTPDLTPDFTSDFTPDFTSGFTRTFDVWLAPERTSQFRQRRKTEQTAYTQNCFG